MSDRALLSQLVAEVRSLRVEVRDLRATLAEREPPSGQLVTARELADALGVSRTTVYEHSEQLGAVRIGTGPKARLRFDLARATAAFADVSEPAAAPPPAEPAAPARVAPAFEPIRAPREAA